MIVAWHEVPGEEQHEHPARRVRLTGVLESFIDRGLIWFGTTRSFSFLSRAFDEERSGLAPPSHRTLRDGLSGAPFQALRARLRII